MYKSQKQRQSVIVKIGSDVLKPKRKPRKKVVKKTVAPPILPGNMRVINAMPSSISTLGLAENIASIIRPSISGIMQNTRPRTLLEEQRVERLLEDPAELRKRRLEKFMSPIDQREFDEATSSTSSSVSLPSGNFEDLGLAFTGSTRGRPRGSKNKPKEQTDAENIFVSPERLPLTEGSGLRFTRPGRNDFETGFEEDDENDEDETERN
jgi:hypothetical protein